MEGHSPVEATDEFMPHLEAEGFAVRVEEDSTAVHADADCMSGVDLVVQCVTMTSIEKHELAGLMSAVDAGTGLAGWHGGIADSCRSSSDDLHLIGGQIACHPGKHPDERRGDATDSFVPYRSRCCRRPTTTRSPPVSTTSTW